MKMHKKVAEVWNYSWNFNRFQAHVLQNLDRWVIFQGVVLEKRKWRIMSRKEVVVSNVSEEHNNPIAELVQVACRFDSDITLESNNRRINAKSIMGIMAFNPSKGMTVNIVAEGSDEEEALVAMEKFLVCE